MQKLGWYDFFPDLPFWPMYLNAQGSTARKLEPGRNRRTTEGSGPRMPVHGKLRLLNQFVTAAIDVTNLCITGESSARAGGHSLIHDRARVREFTVKPASHFTFYFTVKIT